MQENDIAPPGSDCALERGCRCARIDNARGRGARSADDGTPMFWQVADCPLHGVPELLAAHGPVRPRGGA